MCYKLDSKDTIKREFGAFNEIQDGDKYVISLDTKDYSTESVKHINIFDFLMNDDF